MTSVVDRLTRVAEWYESGPGFPREYEEGRQRIAADIRLALEAVATLDRISAMTNADDPDSCRMDNSEDCLDAVRDVAEKQLTRLMW